MTGVRPEYRRLGVATALKMLANRYASQHGYEAIYTRTANPAMLALNEKLGVRRRGSEVRLVKELGDARGAMAEARECRPSQIKQ